MQIERNVTIHRPVSQVFAYVSNPDNNTLWQPEVMEHKMLSDGPLAPGSKMRHVSKFMRRRIEVKLEITEFAPNRKIAFHVVSGTLPYTIYYILDPDGDETRFTYSAAMENRWWLKLIRPLLMASGSKVIEDDLARLKSILEKPMA